MKIKVCGNTNRGSVEALANLSIDYLGCIFVSSSSRAVMVEDVEAFLPLKLPMVGVFCDASEDDIAIAVKRLRLAVVQLHGNEEPAFVKRLREKLPPLTEIWKVVGVGGVDDLLEASKYHGVVDRFLFDTKRDDGRSGGTGKKFSWEILGQYQGRLPYMLAGGISPRDAPLLRELKKFQPFLWGVDINSAFEDEPGKKNIGKIEKFVQELQA